MAKFDFFPVLGSGVYLLANVSMLLLALLKGGKDFPAYDALRWFIKLIENHWSLPVGLLFLAFLIGNVLRALPVNRADELCSVWAEPLSAGFLKCISWLLRRVLFIRCIQKRLATFHASLTRSPFQKDLNHGPFPYRRMLRRQLVMLRRNKIRVRFGIPRDKSAHTMYNFAKAALCGAKNSNFEYTQEQEGRVRLFVNMYWAAFFSMVPNVLGFVLVRRQVINEKWLWIMVAGFSLSMFIAFIFGSQLRRVRGQEVFSVLMAYVAMQVEKRRAGGNSTILPSATTPTASSRPHAHGHV